MWSEIAAIYRASKKRRDINAWTEWVCRPVAAVFVYAVRETRITPNQVTFLSLFVAAVSGAMFIALPGYGGLVAAAVVFEASFVLDCADGQLARLRGSASRLGHLLDFLMDEVKAFLLFGCVAVRLWRAAAHDPLYLLVGVGGMFALASGISMTSFVRRPEYGAPPPTEDGQPAVIARRRGALGGAVTALEHLARFVVHYPSYLWLVALLGRIDIYLWAYAAVNVLYLGRVLLAIFLRLGRFEPAAEPAPAQPAGEEP